MNYIHLFYGYGKGKTSALVGMSARMLGYDKKVIFVQFLKGGETGEINFLKTNPNVVVLRNLQQYGFFNGLSQVEKAQVIEQNNANLRKALELSQTGEYSLLVLDEVLDCVELHAVDESLLLEILHCKYTEIALSGHVLSEKYVALSDYVSQVVKHKHPFDNGVKARKTIEY